MKQTLKVFEPKNRILTSYLSCILLQLQTLNCSLLPNKQFIKVEKI